MDQLILSGVNKTFKRKTGETLPVLNDIHLRVKKGEVLGVIGTNGAGKSTLLNALTGQIRIDSGMIELNNRPIDQLSQVDRSRFIGRVFQDPSMGTAPRMTVFENLMLAEKRGQKRALGISLTEDNYQRMATYLEQFHLNLEKRMDLPIENLSGGQRQIVSLIMATLIEPDLLLLDEHTAALDPRTARQVMTMTKEMIDQYNLTTVMITHRLQDALDYCNQVIVMHHGQIVKHYNQEELTTTNASDLYNYLESLVN